MQAAFRPGQALPRRQPAAPAQAWSSYGRPIERPAGFAESDQAVIADIGASADIRNPERATAAEPGLSRPLGVPRAQLHQNYIVAQTGDGMVIVDQHAAHERLVYERLKSAIAKRDVATQMLLVPEIAELPPEDVDRLLSRADELSAFGLTLEQFGPGAVAIREVPAMLDGVDIKGLVEDLAAEIAEIETTTRLAERIDKVAGTIACHGSVRSGRRLRPEEMDALLRQMEAEPYSGQCIHGRPTYIELKLADLERLFGRR
jgi:DNA mismatch repair protein MutL